MGTWRWVWLCGVGVCGKGVYNSKKGVRRRGCGPEEAFDQNSHTSPNPKTQKQVYHLLPSSSTSTTDDGKQQYELAPFTTLAEHDDLASALAAGKGDDNAALLATGSWDCSVRVWDLGSPATSQRQFLGG